MSAAIKHAGELLKPHSLYVLPLIYVHVDCALAFPAPEHEPTLLMLTSFGHGGTPANSPKAKTQVSPKGGRNGGVHLRIRGRMAYTAFDAAAGFAPVWPLKISSAAERIWFKTQGVV